MEALKTIPNPPSFDYKKARIDMSALRAKLEALDFDEAVVWDRHPRSGNNPEFNALRNLLWRMKQESIERYEFINYKSRLTKIDGQNRRIVFKEKFEPTLEERYGAANRAKELAYRALRARQPDATIEDKRAYPPLHKLQNAMRVLELHKRWVSHNKQEQN